MRLILTLATLAMLSPLLGAHGSSSTDTTLDGRDSQRTIVPCGFVLRDISAFRLSLEGWDPEKTAGILAGPLPTARD